MTKKTLKEHIIRRIKSFKYAFNGIRFVFFTQTNMQIHLAIAIIVTIFGFYFKISHNEWLILILTFALVLVSETINTAIEQLVNFISPQYNKKAGLIKDISAAFVLISAIFAIIVGLIIFIPKFIK